MIVSWTYSNKVESKPSSSIFNLTASFGTPKCSIFTYFWYAGSAPNVGGSIGFSFSFSSWTTWLSGGSSLFVTWIFLTSCSLFSSMVCVLFSSPGTDDNCV